MATKLRRTGPERQATRVSVSFTPDQYEGLTSEARRRRVSVAWVVRDAVYQYLNAESPLFSLSQPDQKGR
jgi:hypothetical protein